MKVIKQKNADLKLKLEAWKKRLEERKRLKRRTFEHGKKLREIFSKLSHDFNIEKEKVIECIINYNYLAEEKDKYDLEEKIINDFLS